MKKQRKWLERYKEEDHKGKVEREREREREYNYLDSDVGCEEDCALEKAVE